MFKFFRRVREKFISFAMGPHSVFWLSFLSFIEAIFFPFPPDFLLVAILSTKENRRWVFYSLVTSLSSVFGGMFGYFVGYAFFGLFGEKIIYFYGLEEPFLRMSHILEEGAFLSVFVAALTPIPYKVFTISSGFFEINFTVFMIASLLGRMARFFLVGGIMHFFGQSIRGSVYRHTNIIAGIIAILLVGIVILFVY